jgi:hypothetical protein
MLRARIPPPPHLPGMFRHEEVLDFPAEVVDVAGVTKAAFNAGFPSADYSLASSRRGLNDSSQAIYCLEWASEEIRPVGHGMMGGCWYRTRRRPDSDG